MSSEPGADENVVETHGILDRLGRLQNTFGVIAGIRDALETLGDTIVVSELPGALDAFKRFRDVKADADMSNPADRSEVIGAALDFLTEAADVTTTEIDDTFVETCKRLRANLPFVDNLIGGILVARAAEGSVHPAGSPLVVVAASNNELTALALDSATVSLIISIAIDLISRWRARRQNP